MSPDAIAQVIDDGRREYDLLVMAQQKLAEMLAKGGLALPAQHDTSAIRDAMLALGTPL